MSPDRLRRRPASPALWALAGAAGLTGVLYVIQALGMRDLVEPLRFSSRKWYFLAPIVLGFSVQTGLFRAMHLKAVRAGLPMVASGGTSTTSMIACCLHNLTPLAPLAGLGGLAAFTSKYQDAIFAFSVAVTAAGTALMLKKYLRLDASAACRTHQ